MMKKFLSVLLVFSLLLSSALFSCENKPDNTENDVTTSPPTQEAPKYSEQDQRLMNNIISIMEEKGENVDLAKALYAFGKAVIAARDAIEY